MSDNKIGMMTVSTAEIKNTVTHELFNTKTAEM